MHISVVETLSRKTPAFAHSSRDRNQAIMVMDQRSEKGCTFVSPFPWELLQKKFKLYLEANGLSERTKKDYRYHINKFFTQYPKAVKSEDNLRTYVQKHLGGDIKPATHNLRRQYLKAFFEWCIEEGKLSKNPLRGIKKKKNVYRDLVVDDSRIAALILAIDSSTFTGKRDLAMVYMTLDTGIRPSEVRGLLPSDIIRGKEPAVHIRATIAKDRKGRTLPVSSQTVEMITSYERMRASKRIAGEETTLFCTEKGKDLTQDAWASCLKRHCKKAGVRISPYDLRHYFAVLFLRHGGETEILRQILGHEDERTLKFYTRMACLDLRKGLEKASPLSNVLAAS